jgi:quercetin dioxygenase-like cupin family protein
MKRLAAAAMSLALSVSAVQSKEHTPMITVMQSGEKPSVKGPSEYFTGTVRIDSPFQGTEPARVGGATVTFEPSARTAWHTHPLGQTLIVTTGLGLVQEWGKPVREIRPGDIVWIPAGVKHWHGAAPETSMSHIAIAEAQEGNVVDWMEKVSDEQYASSKKS